MFSRIEARNFRSLRYITQDMGPFQALVGPNASGKTTYFDVINFLHDVVTNDVSYALKIRDIVTIHDMFWNGEGEEFELAVECLVPEAVANFKSSVSGLSLLNDHRNYQ